MILARDDSREVSMQYAQPRLLNSVSITMLIIALCGGYWGWRFFPSYWDSWTVDHHLQEGAASVYGLIGAQAPNENNESSLKDLVDTTRKKILEAVPIADPNFAVNLDVKPGVGATMTADYDVYIEHPLIEKKTKIHFHRVGEADLKQVKW
jgi:hypothetical protein